MSAQKSFARLSIMKLLAVTAFFTTGLIIGIKIDQSPSYIESQFVEQCSELNGKEFSEATIRSLFGYCYVDCSAQKDRSCIKTEKCTEKHVSDFLKSYAESAKDEHGLDKDLHISQRGLKNTWRCIINNTESGMKAKVLYVFD